MDNIHFANLRYWKQGNQATRTARAEYQGRLQLLERIRTQLAQLWQSF